MCFGVKGCDCVHIGGCYYRRGKGGNLIRVAPPQRSWRTKKERKKWFADAKRKRLSGD